MTMAYNGQIYNSQPQIVNRSAGYGNIVANNAGPVPQPVPRPAMRTPPPIRTIYAQKTTKNKSFLDMHHYLKSIGIKNNEFMLTLIDPDLDGIDPHDPNLNAYYKQKVLRECLVNYW